MPRLMQTESAGQPRLVVSVVSHRQGALIARLWEDLASVCHTPLQVVLTVNTPETLPDLSLPFPLTLIRNVRPRGFAANHNAAAAAVDSDVFCVLNPDVRLTSDPFPLLLQVLRDPDVGVAAPLVVGTRGDLQDSARPLPTPMVALTRFLFGTPAPAPLTAPAWVAGMCMVFRTATFQAVGGFDPRYFLYYEDCDLCCRLRLAGFRVELCPDVAIIHDAQRTSRRRPRYLLWHLQSAVRFFRSPAYRQLRERDVR